MRSIKSLVIAFIMPLAIAMSGCAGRKAAQGPVPVTYIMVCCHSMDRGTKFLINGEWDSKHDYKDYETALGLMRQNKQIRLTNGLKRQRDKQINFAYLAVNQYFKSITIS